MIYASRRLLLPLLASSSVLALSFLSLPFLLHCLWLYCRVAVGVTVVLVPMLYVLRAVGLQVVASATLPKRPAHYLATSGQAC